MMTNLNAVLLPLTGKYYGTKVEISNGDWTEYIVIWLPGKLSKRELEKSDTSDLSEIISDGHYESDNSLKIAELIVDTINQKDLVIG